MTLHRKGFTLVEIMIVVAIIGLVAAIAVPNFFRSRDTAEKNTCIANLKQIQTAVQIWALDTGSSASETPTLEDLVPNYIRSWPTCKGVAYVVPEVSADPVCPNTTTGHALVINNGSSGTS
jgi:type II secretion system protein G